MVFFTKLFNKKAANVILGASMALSAWHGGYSLWRKASDADSGVAKDQPTAFQGRAMSDGLDALNTAYPTGADKVWGSRDDQFTRGFFGEISGKAKENFDVVDVVSDKDGELSGLHTVLLAHKESGRRILAVCGMEVPKEHLSHDLPDVFNSLYLYQPSVPDQFPHVVQTFDDLQAKHGPIDLVAGHSIGGMCVQMLAAGRDVDVVAFASAGLTDSLVDDCAAYFEISPEVALQNMHERCVSVPATMYSSLGFQPGDNFWPASASSTNPNFMQHGTFEMNAAVQAGNFTADGSPVVGSLIPSGSVALMALAGFAAVNIRRSKPETTFKSALE